jgi:hypothetical protein
MRAEHAGLPYNSVMPTSFFAANQTWMAGTSLNKSGQDDIIIP